MHPVEINVLQWIASHAPPEIRHALASQLKQAEISGREYTNGGGVFVSFSPSKDSMAVPAEWLASYSSVEGPDLLAPELESGACAILHINQRGFADSLEIFAYAVDYPRDRHPENIRLVHPSGTYIDLREQGE